MASRTTADRPSRLSWPWLPRVSGERTSRTRPVAWVARRTSASAARPWAVSTGPDRAWTSTCSMAGLLNPAWSSVRLAAAESPSSVSVVLSFCVPTPPPTTAARITNAIHPTIARVRWCSSGPSWRRCCATRLLRRWSWCPPRWRSDVTDDARSRGAALPCGARHIGGPGGPIPGVGKALRSGRSTRVHSLEGPCRTP